jgi:hypothetical protein
MGGVERLCGLGISRFTGRRDATGVSCRKCGPHRGEARLLLDDRADRGGCLKSGVWCERPEVRTSEDAGVARCETRIARGNLVAGDWDDMSVDEKLEHLLSAVKTLERRQDDLLRHVSELADAIAAMELKLRQ